MYLSINGSIDPTLTLTKFRQIFSNGAPKKSIQPFNLEPLTQQEYDEVETELAKVLNPTQKSDLMQILRGIGSNPIKAAVRFLFILPNNKYVII